MYGCPMYRGPGSSSGVSGRNHGSISRCSSVYAQGKVYLTYASHVNRSRVDSFWEGKHYRGVENVHAEDIAVAVGNIVCPPSRGRTVYWHSTLRPDVIAPQGFPFFDYIDCAIICHCSPALYEDRAFPAGRQVQTPDSSTHLGQA